MKIQSKIAAALLLLGAALTDGRAELIGFFPFDDETDPLKDESPTGIYGPLQSTGDPLADPVYEPSGGLNGTGIYMFDGGDRLLANLDLSPDMIPSLTMGAWVRATDINPGLRKVIGSDDGGWDRSIGLDTRGAGGFAYSTFTGGGVLSSEKAPPSTEAWAFIAATYDQAAGTVTLYVDEDISTGGMSVRTTSGTFSVGAFQTAIGSVSPIPTAEGATVEGWIGAVDNVFFYDEILNYEQIAAIRDGGKNAILGVPGGGDDPNLSITSMPDLSALPKTPEVKTLAFPIMNTGAGNALQISEVTISGADASHFSVESFPDSIAAGASGTLNITFDTKGQVGDFEAEVQITSNDESTAEYFVELRPRVVAPALLGFYSFDDEANPLKDDSGANRTLTAPAMPIHEPAGGIEGGAFLFDGTHRLAAPININPSSVPNLTMGAWVRTDALEGLHKIMGHDNGGWDRTLGLDTRGAEPNTHYTAFAGRGAYPLTDPLAVPYDTTIWSFVAVVYEQDANRVTTYVDLDVASEDDPLLTGTTTTTLGDGAAAVGIGGIAPSGTGEPWIGHIDNVFFIEGAFDAAQMEELRNEGKAFFAAGLQPDPILAFAGGPVFGDLPGSGPVTREVRISNAGSTQPLRISRVELSGPDASLYSVGELPGPIAPGEEGIIPVTITPDDRLGGVTAQLAVYSNNSGSRASSVNLNAYIPFPSARSALVAFYPFDEADPLADATGGGATATIDPLFEPSYDASAGFEGGAYVFTEAQRIAAPVNINPSAAPKLTMGAWVKTTALDAINRKFMGHDNGGWDRAIGIDNRGTAGLTTHHYTAFAGRDAFPLTDPPATPVSADDWTFVAAVYDQIAATVTTYIDMDASTTADPLMTGTATTTMGEGLGNLGIGAISATGNEFWGGVIDNVFVYETGLTEAQIAAIRDGGAEAILAADEPGIEITGIERDDNVTLTWSSSEGQSYNVQYKATLDEDWGDIATVPGEAGSTTYTDTDATRLGRATGFYRIAR